jgi:excisionase family DNA binding protein
MEELQRQIDTMPEYEWLRDKAHMWYTTHEVAQGLGFTPPTVRKMCEAGSFPGARFYEAGWRIPRSGILEYLSQTGGGARNRA